MTNIKKNILSDALLFLKENYEPTKSWTVESKYASISPSKKTALIEPLPIQQEKIKRDPPEKKTLTPAPLSAPPPIQESAQGIPSFIKKEEHPLPFKELSKDLHKSFPHFTINSTPLSDQAGYIKALQVRSLIFSFKEGRESDLFLENIQKAITSYHGPSSICHALKWKTAEEISLFFSEMQAEVIIASTALLKNPLLLPFLKEIPASSERFLGKSRLILMEPFTTYFTNPQSKKVLWQTICSILKNPNTQASS